MEVGAGCIVLVGGVSTKILPVRVAQGVLWKGLENGLAVPANGKCELLLTFTNSQHDSPCAYDPSGMILHELSLLVAVSSRLLKELTVTFGV